MIKMFEQHMAGYVDIPRVEKRMMEIDAYFKRGGSYEEMSKWLSEYDRLLSILRYAESEQGERK